MINISVYKTSGVCSQFIEFQVSQNIVKDVNFTGGCDGNLKGICSLVEGMDIDSVINKLKGTKCGFRNTSCPDQLAKALESWKNNQENN